LSRRLRRTIVHRNLVIEAAEAGVSLNRLVSAKLAHG
jgi:predicted HicB family RNase H-like nuclease